MAMAAATALAGADSVLVGFVALGGGGVFGAGLQAQRGRQHQAAQHLVE